MRSAVRCLTLASAALLLATSPLALAATIPVCTSEQEAAYKPYDGSSVAAGCDLVTFQTCSDNCLAERKLAAEHAPNCISSTSPSRPIATYLETASQRFKACEDARTSTTSKYTPQKVRDAPNCGLAVVAKFDADATFKDCAIGAFKNCSDACLKVIEDKIASAPVCLSDFDEYTVGESKKEVLVKCLKARNEDLAQNKVLNTVVGGTPNKESGAGTLVSTTMVAAASVVVLVLSIQ